MLKTHFDSYYQLYQNRLRFDAFIGDTPVSPMFIKREVSLKERLHALAILLFAFVLSPFQRYYQAVLKESSAILFKGFWILLPCANPSSSAPLAQPSSNTNHQKNKTVKKTSDPRSSCPRTGHSLSNRRIQSGIGHEARALTSPGYKRLTSIPEGVEISASSSSSADESGASEASSLIIHSDQESQAPSPLFLHKASLTLETDEHRRLLRKARREKIEERRKQAAPAASSFIESLAFQVKDTVASQAGSTTRARHRRSEPILGDFTFDKTSIV
jgi:hypothetical protein